ncbi:YlxR family protein [Janibacter sp. YIM B02568]|nr:YlxR family protein [Janibacter endophyticus]
MAGIDRTGLRASASEAGPQRTCIGCRRTDSRSVLLRVVAEPRGDGNPVVVPDPRRRLPGRGAWIHPDTVCLDLAVRRRAFARALRAPVEGVDALRAWVDEHSQVTPPSQKTESGFDADEHPMSTQR